MLPFTQQAKSIYTVNDSPRILVRFLGLDVSPVWRSWRPLWGFLCMWMATEPRQSSICNSIHAYWQTCPLFHPWIPSKVEVDTPSFKIRSGTPHALASVWPQTLSFASENNSRIGIHGSFLFLSFHSWEREIMWRRFSFKRRKKSFAKAEGFVVVIGNLGKYTLFVFVMSSSALQWELW